MIDPLQLLCDLVAMPTQQAGPDGVAGDERAVCEMLAPLLRDLGAAVHIEDAPRKHGGPGAYIFASWGTPTTLLNAHIDTVPANSGWTTPPWQPQRTATRITGLGACDTKGAIAAAIAAVQAIPAAQRQGFGLLFSGDEERGTASVDKFLASPRCQNIKRAIVCEPTARRAGIAHRGVLSYRVRLQGEGGHSSKADHLTKPLAALARLATKLDDYAIANLHAGPSAMPGLCLNIAGLTGGVAFNVIPTSAELQFSLRPAPGFDLAAWEQTLAGFAHAIDPRITIEQAVDHAPFASLDGAAMQAWVAPHVSSVGPLDFWTEAALYMAAGIDAVVIGPGDIAQAHSADEWVAIDDIHWAVATFTQLLQAHA
jgi:acetylornithine deacetylase